MVFSPRIRLLLSCLLLTVWATVFGIPHGINTFSQAFLEFASRTWPAAEAKIVSRTVYPLPGGRRSGDEFRRFGAHIWFEYIADGVAVSGNAVVPDNTDAAASQSDLERQFAVGKTVRVHYRPGDPFQYILEPGLQWTTLMNVMQVVLELLLFAAWFSWLVRLLQPSRRSGGRATASETAAA